MRIINTIQVVPQPFAEATFYPTEILDWSPARRSIFLLKSEPGPPRFIIFVRFVFLQSYPCLFQYFRAPVPYDLSQIRRDTHQEKLSSHFRETPQMVLLPAFVLLIILMKRLGKPLTLHVCFPSPITGELLSHQVAVPFSGVYHDYPLLPFRTSSV